MDLQEPPHSQDYKKSFRILQMLQFQKRIFLKLRNPFVLCEKMVSKLVGKNKPANWRRYLQAKLSMLQACDLWPILDWYIYRPEHGINIGIRTLARKVFSSSWKVTVEVGLTTWQTLKKYKLKRDSFMQSRI